jgi:photosystem II stability/assembly factor-like uncharacterized protein
MSRLRRTAATAVTAACAAAAVPATAGAVTWTEVASGTTSEITAIAYQGADRFLLTTSAGSILRRGPDGTFTTVRAPSGIRLNDIEFLRGTGTGFAVGNGGQVLRSLDGGTTWNDVSAGIPVSKTGTTFPDCTDSAPLSDVNSVRFAGPSAVWIFATGSQLAKSTAADLGATGTWVDANRDTKGTADPADDTCRIRGDLYGDGHADGFFATPQVGYIVSASFAKVYFTADGLASDAVAKPAEAGNAGSNRRELVGDPANPSRMWSVAPEPYGLSTTGYTDDGYGTEDRFTIVNDTKREFPSNGPYSVDFSDGTVLAAGDAGLILASTDGRNFNYVDAPGGLASQNWRAVALAGATAGAVGGVDGKLIVTTNATGKPGTTTTLAQPGLPAKPPVAGKVARKKGKYVVIKVRGRIGVPAGIAHSAACRGTMSLSIYKGKKRIGAKKTKVRSSCRYAKTVRARRSRVGRAKRIKLKVAFKGNAVLAPLSSTYSIKVKR